MRLMGMEALGPKPRTSRRTLTAAFPLISVPSTRDTQASCAHWHRKGVFKTAGKLPQLAA